MNTFLTVVLVLGYLYDVRRNLHADDFCLWINPGPSKNSNNWDTYYHGSEAACHAKMAEFVKVFEMEQASRVEEVPEVVPLPVVPAVLASVEFYLSGHLGRRFPEEQMTTSDCGSCDGAHCDCCDKVWVVGEERFFDQAEAAAAAEWLGSSLLQLVGSKELAERSHFDFYLNAENHLCVLGGDSGEEEFVCNPQSHLYEEKWYAALEAKERFAACPCVDKNEDDYANSCCRVGCNDSACYRETRTRGRKERKWYM